MLSGACRLPSETYPENVPTHAVLHAEAILVSPPENAEDAVIVEALARDKVENDVPDRIDQRIIIPLSWFTQFRVNDHSIGATDLHVGDRVSVIFHLEKGMRVADVIVASREK